MRLLKYGQARPRTHPVYDDCSVWKPRGNRAAVSVLTMVLKIDAEPEPLPLELAKTALIVIDMQRDFLEPGGFGESLGNDVSLLARAITPCRALLEAMRARGVLIIHTREGHRPDLSDAP